MANQEKENITLKIGDKEVTFKRPDRKTVSLAMTKAFKNPLDGAEVIVDNCYVGGDYSKEELLNDVALLTGLANFTNNIIGVPEIELKKK